MVPVVVSRFTVSLHLGGGGIPPPPPKRGLQPPFGSCCVPTQPPSPGAPFDDSAPEGGGGGTARQATDGLWTEARGQHKQSNDPRNNQHNPRCANYWAPLTRKRHIPPHPAQPRHTNDWAPRTRKQHQREHRPQRPTERSDPTQHAKGRTGDCPGPRKGATTRRTVTQGGLDPPALNGHHGLWEKRPRQRKGE